MTYLGGSLAGMTADRNLWKSRADMAWGPNHSWQSGSSWEAMYGTSQTNLTNMTNSYNAMVAERDAWIANYNAAIASRDYWQHTVAHNDANVWDNRYNAGYNAGVPAGAASKTTTTHSVGLAGTGTLNWAAYSGDLGGIACPRTGLCHASAKVGSNGDDAAIHIFRNGNLQIGSPGANGGLNTTFAVQGAFNVNSGDYISVRATGDPDNSGLQGGTLIITVGSV